ncbi:MAG: hypothetical protein A3G33_00230 [Omnitrophica bacterium RIFCSPLOWO2_12_FULL_44_17]|uniref:DUF3313 domain-containing protein n=1 Tax=Candidatus Danuiimicrobium aquiferis TaxID=1801832 RepID=A0A1G1L110_9BACT|nr:MAG: hypothetical protein A3B72_10210 [Omnitrophica bacterium RIFCSPHIGHO2_02_FULL_45_28]OGW90773.1 MAG: hypothetical protein A3E74_05490 [Omnitrophica bacterium RIFCSPHIGHO2_12_FULL_44_12]OGW98825.1 MAG: hypothetical protein A3G33_00230 [Omnitrophica bacterium RIFCSPLOWO2_12_FULL_44_17]OGX02863.1 MAG: hypothetical protein A3J12_01625 [Omnitrophica bacterium RIFCSPLOWO2_02_FULL_44_11]
MKIVKIIQIGFFLFCLFPWFAGCATKADPAPPAGFVDTGIMIQDETVPFQKVWFQNGFDWKQYSSIYIANVDTSYLSNKDTQGDPEKEGSGQQDIQELAMYMQGMFRVAFLNDPMRKYQLAYKFGDGVLILEIALIEAVPTNVPLEAAGYVGGPLFGTVGKVAGSVAKSFLRSTVAFEARLKDGRTGEVVAMFADREGEKSSIVNVKDFSWYAHAKSIINEWAVQFVQISNKAPGGVIEDSGTFDLKPW